MIKYSSEIKFNKNDLAELFLSVGWNSGKYPNKIYNAILNSDHFYFAYDGDNLIGVISAISDKSINLFITYLLVHTDYQENGVGTKLLNKISNIKGFNRIILISESGKEKFYTTNNFISDGTGMFKINWDK